MFFESQNKSEFFDGQAKSKMLTNSVGSQRILF